MHLLLVDLGVDEDLADGLEGAAEEVLAKLFEMHAGEGGVEIDTLEESRSQSRSGLRKKGCACHARKQCRVDGGARALLDMSKKNINKYLS